MFKRRQKKNFTEIRRNIIENIARFKMINKLSYQDLAKKSGLSRPLIHNFLNLDSDFRLEDIEAMASAIGMTFHEIISPIESTDTDADFIDLKDD